MKINSKTFQLMKQVPNSTYGFIKTMFLYYSNKLEGSTFTLEALQMLCYEHRIIQTEEQQLYFDDVTQTKNSLDVFDYIIDTLGTPITKEYICHIHKLLTQGSSIDTNLHVSGMYKLFPNRIHNSSVQVALPDEVEQGVKDLFASWNQSSHMLEDIAYFHTRFEHIHPFQDGNGRIGRFLVLKQCIENDVDIVMIDDENSNLYKAMLETAQINNDMSGLLKVFTICQKRFDDECQSLTKDLAFFENYCKNEKE